MISSLDYTILEWIHQHRIESLDAVVKWFSFVTTYVSIGMIVVVAVFCYIRQKGWGKPIQLAVTLSLTGIFSFILKAIFDRIRPFVIYDTIEKLSSGGSPSFPSGHTFEAFAMATAISLLIPNRKIRIAVFIWAILVGYSRIALGVHYPTDVFAGMLLGILLAIGVDFVFRRYFKRLFSRK